MRLSKKSLLIGTLLSSAMMAVPAHAQVELDGEGIDDEIVVTGSRIQRSQDFVANSPVATVEEVQFERTGTINTEQLLNVVPQTVPGLTRTSNNPGNGTASVDLRGLGSNRTLVLVNGRRAQPTGAGGVVDINTIPPSLIESVEVLTGGASSVYGADAVAGVVNFILKDDFEGVEARAGFQATDQGDAEIYNGSVTVGANFDDGRGNAAATIGYTNRSALFQGDRDFSTVALFDDGNGGLEPGGSSGVPGNSIFNGGFLSTQQCAVPVTDPMGECPEASLTTTPGAFPNTAGAVFNADGSAREFVTAGQVNDFYNYAPVNFIQLPQERFTLYTTADYEINDHFEVFVEGRFVQSEVPQQLAPTPIFQSTTFSLDNNPFITPETQQALSGNNTGQIGIGDRVARVLADPTSPFNPQPAMGETQNLCVNCVFDSDGDGFNDVAPLIDTDGDGIADTASALVRRRLVEVGPRVGNDNRQTFQLVGGLRGDITDNVGYEVFYSEGRTNNSSFQNGNVNRGRFNQALILADDGNGNVDTTNVRCADGGTNGSTVGCSPLNIFGAGNISEDAAAFLRTAVSTTDETIQRVLQGNITGDFGDNFKIAEDTIGFAFGAEYIDNQFEFRPSQDVAASTIAGFNGAPPVQGDFDVYSAYGELAIPLVQGLPFAENITLDLAGRVSDFSTAGTQYNYKVGGDWAVNDLLRLRGNYNTAVRAPNIGELFSPQGENFPGADDPCAADGGFAGNDAVRAVCAATGVPSAVIFSPAINPAAGQVRSLAGGNPDLDVETAETFTIGAVISPDLFDGFTASIDYYNIEIEDIVTTFGGGTDNILRTCYTDTELGGAGSVFCNQVNRRPDGTINFVSNLGANAAFLQTSGIDLALQANTNTDFLMDGALGNVYASYLGTIVLENEFQAFEGDTVFDCAGYFGNNCGEPDPEYRHFVTLGTNAGMFNVQATWQMLGSVTDGAELEPDFAPGDEQSVSEIGDEHYFGLSGTADIGDNLALTLGVNNLLDNNPPVIGDNDEQANTYPSTYDVFGRTFFGNVRVNF